MVIASDIIKPIPLFNDSVIESLKSIATSVFVPVQYQV